MSGGTKTPGCPPTRAAVGWLVVATLAFVACDSTADPTGLDAPAELQRAAGNDQVGEVGEVLTGPVTVRVVDGRGRPVAGATVAWEVAEGGGAASPSTGTTGADGRASTLWTLGPPVGTQRITAKLTGVAPATFVAEGRAGAPHRIAVSPANVLLRLEEGQDETRVEARVLDRFDNETGGTVTWSVPDGNVASVDATGTVRGIGAGFSVVAARVGTVLGGASLTVENPVPSLATLTPSSVVAGAPETTVELNGSGFVATSVVLWNGTPRPSTFVSSDVLRVHVPAADLERVGSASVRVLSAAPGGGFTETLEFTVESRVPTLVITADPAATSVSGWVEVAVEAYDADGRRVSAPVIEWSWPDAGLHGHPDGHRGGRVRARAVGTARIAAAWSDFAVDTLEVPVTGIDERLRSVTSGGSLSCGLDDGGAAYCWGWHHVGQTPDGAYAYSSETWAPAPVAGGRRFASLTVGIWHACGLDAAGTAWCWYDDLYGQLGRGLPTSAAAEPAPVSGDGRFRELVATGWHTCGVTFHDEAWCWGANLYGQLGVGDQAVRHVPVRVAGDVAFRSLAVGGYHTCGLTPEGEAYCWGFGGHGQLGRTDGDVCADPIHGTAPCAFTPGRVDTDLRFTALAVGGLFTCGLTRTGEAWCWGSGTRGQLGDGVTGGTTTPVRVVAPVAFESLRAGYAFACGLAAGGVAWCWGENDYATIGHEPAFSDDCVENGSAYACEPLPVPLGGGLTFTTLSTGWRHACGTTAAGRVVCWGHASDGQLGRGGPAATYYEVEPAPVWDGWMATTPLTSLPSAAGAVGGRPPVPEGPGIEGAYHPDRPGGPPTTVALVGTRSRR